MLAEAAIVAVKKGGKVEVTINVNADLGVQITAREVDGKGGVRGNIPKPKAMEREREHDKICCTSWQRRPPFRS